MSAKLVIHRAGPGVTVQDLGRTGYLAQGLSRGGAADPLSIAEGAALLSRYGSADKASEIEMQQLNKVLAAKWPRFPYKLEFDAGELSSMMTQAYDSPLWDQLADICLACGQCTLVCPTCARKISEASQRPWSFAGKFCHSSRERATPSSSITPSSSRWSTGIARRSG